MAANPQDFEDDNSPDDPDGEIHQTDFDDSVEDTDDGGAIVRMDEDQDTPADAEEFYHNLADELDASDLSSMALELITKIDYDKDSRKERDKQQEMAIRRTGLGDDAPGGADFEGASKVVHPMLTKATIEFESRAIGELLPPDGPVKDYIPGTSTKARVEKAKRKKSYMNWQFMVQMPEFRSELEQLLTQLPLGGSQYLRLVYDQKKKRPVPIFVPIDDVYLPYAASSFYSAERSTYVEHITKFEFENRVESGQYRDGDNLAETASTASTPETTDSAKASQRIEGVVQNAYNTDGLRDIYEVMTYADLEDDYGYAPYLISICATSHKVLAVVRNWEEDDDKKEPMYWMAEFGFVPWRGVYHIGLGQMIGWISAAATGALRALLDSAHINNLPTLLKLKGTNFTGQSVQLAATQITEIEGGVATDDIRKLIMPIPFNAPSSVLVELLGLLIKEGDDTVRTAMDNLADNANADMPVGTTLALIEQGMKVLSAIHQRLHHSMNQVIKILHRINRLYVTDDEIKDETGELMALRSDFQAPLDVVPVSDPQIFSDIQRVAQIQMVASRAAGNPLYDQRKVEELILERTKIPNAKDLLIAQPEAKPMNAVNENAAASLGRPIAAFPEQEHLAHLQVHLDFLNSPYFGALAVIAPNFVPAMLSHIREHVVLWYVNEFYEMTRKACEAEGLNIEDAMKEKDPNASKELDKLLAEASPDVIEAAAQPFGDYPQIVGQALELAKQYAPPQIDPATGVAQIQAQSRQQTDAARSRDVQTREEAATQREALKATAKAKDTVTTETAEDKRAQFKETQQNTRSQADNQSREHMNQQDNLTAMTIASAEIENDQHSRLSTGTGINPGVDE